MLNTSDYIDKKVSPGDVKRAREALGLTQKEVADTLDYRQGTIAKFELGHIPVSRQFIQAWNDKFLLKLGEIDTTDRSANKWKGHLQVPLSAECTARVEFNGFVTRDAIHKLISHLEMTIDAFPVSIPEEY